MPSRSRSILSLPLFRRQSSSSSADSSFSTKKQLRKLASKRRWSDLLRALDSLPLGASQVSRDDFQGHVLLHHVVSDDPPVDVVNRLIEVYPEALTVGGMSGALPLHCAVMYGSGDGVVAALVEARVESAMERDAEGRTALHLAVCKACDALGSEDGTGKEEREKERRRALAVVEILCRNSSVDAVDMVDGNGLTPIDVAVSREEGEDCPVTILLRNRSATRRTRDDDNDDDGSSSGSGRSRRHPSNISIESENEGGNDKEWGEARLRELMELTRHHQQQNRREMGRNSATAVERNASGPPAA